MESIVNLYPYCTLIFHSGRGMTVFTLMGRYSASLRCWWDHASSALYWASCKRLSKSPYPRSPSHTRALSAYSIRFHDDLRYEDHPNPLPNVVCDVLRIRKEEVWSRLNKTHELLMLFTSKPAGVSIFRDINLGNLRLPWLKFFVFDFNSIRRFPRLFACFVYLFILSWKAVLNSLFCAKEWVHWIFCCGHQDWWRLFNKTMQVFGRIHQQNRDIEDHMDAVSTFLKENGCAVKLIIWLLLHAYNAVVSARIMITNVQRRKRASDSP